MNEELNVQQEPVTDVTENTDAQAVEDNEEGIELTDTTSSNEETKEVKTYTEEDLERIVNERVNSILPNKIEREKRKIEKDYREKLSKYEETESILSAGLGTKDITEANQKMRQFYQEQGLNIPAYQKPNYSEHDEKVLGEAEAREIIALGYEEMQDEANRLADIGMDKMTSRQKVIFNTLATELTNENNKRELAKLGAPKEILEDLNFRQFSSQFNSKTPISTIYEMYTKMSQPKKKVEQIGSMKNTKGTNNSVKDFYTREEALKFTTKDFDKNPALLKAVEKSMTKW